ncbi:unnamed protein product [Caenorhabditis brenneri]
MSYHSRQNASKQHAYGSEGFMVDGAHELADRLACAHFGGIAPRPRKSMEI